LNEPIERPLEVPSSLPTGFKKFSLKFSRLAALGMVSSYLMHEFRNSLAVVSGHAQIIQVRDGKVSSEDLVNRMDEVMIQIDRILDIFEGVGSFASRAVGEKVDVHPDSTLENALLSMRRQLESRGLKISSKTSGGDLKFWCDASLFDYIILQLLDVCIPEKRIEGKLVIKTTSDDRYWQLKLNLNESGGDGHLFSGFIKRASGFELTAALIAVESMGGELYLRSDTQDYGFRLVLPWKTAD